MLHVFQSVDDQWYWRFKAGNGKIVADGSEGYVSRGNARRAANRAARLISEWAAERTA